MNALRAFTATIAALAFMPVGVESQGTYESSRYPVAIVEVDSLSPGSGAFEVIRRSDFSPSDVILVREHTSPAVLSQAVWTVIVAHQIEPQVPEQDQTIRLADGAADVAGRRQFSWVESVLEDLKNAQVVKIQGLGYHKAVIITVPREVRPSP